MTLAKTCSFEQEASQPITDASIANTLAFPIVAQNLSTETSISASNKSMSSKIITETRERKFRPRFADEGLESLNGSDTEGGSDLFDTEDMDEIEMSISSDLPKDTPNRFGMF